MKRGEEGGEILGTWMENPSLVSYIVIFVCTECLLFRFMEFYITAMNIVIIKLCINEIYNITL